MSASLYTIHQTLQELHELRQQVADDGDLEAVAAVDQQIAEWLDRSPEKVTSYVGLIRQRENTVAACKAERARIKAIEDSAEADIERLKSNVLGAMQRFDIRELSAKPGGGFRRQGNGGVEPVEIADVDDVPLEYKIATIKVNVGALAGTIRIIMDSEHESSFHNLRAAVSVLIRQLSQHSSEPDLKLLREALKQRVICDVCQGHGMIDATMTLETDPHDIKCSVCGGAGTIPATIPGARLLPKGEHVIIFPKSPKEIEP